MNCPIPRVIPLSKLSEAQFNMYGRARRPLDGQVD